MITKTEAIFHKEDDDSEFVDFIHIVDDQTVSRRLTFETETWADMGSPDTVTVTIEPGDRLNDGS